MSDRFIEVPLDSLPEETQSAVRDIMAREGVEQAEALQRLLEMGARAAQDRREQDPSAEQAVRFMRSLLPPEEPG